MGFSGCKELFTFYKKDSPEARIVATHTKTQEKNIPIVLAVNACLFGILKRYAAIVPAYTPVPGMGIITNRIRPQNPYFRTPFPAPFLALFATLIALDL